MVTPSRAPPAASCGDLGYSVGGGAPGGDPAPGVGSGGSITLSLSMPLPPGSGLPAGSHAPALGSHSEAPAALTVLDKGAAVAVLPAFWCREHLWLAAAARLHGAAARWPPLCCASACTTADGFTADGP